jgi:LysM repeat protein
MHFIKQLFIIFALICIQACSPSSSVNADPVETAEEIASSLDEISSALDTIKDYDTMRSAEVIIDKAGDNLVKLYASVKDQSTNEENITKIKQIIEPASKRMQEKQESTLKKFSENQAVTYGIVIMFNNLSKKYQETTGITPETNVIPATEKK